MQIAGVDIYVNHPVLHLGATDRVPLPLALNAAPAASCDTHVAVRGSTPERADQGASLHTA